MPTDGFIHRFVPGDTARPPVLLLHGTGGDENDLIDLGRAVAPGSALVSPRGRVLEGGMPRFFRRLAEGVFDEEDVRVQTQALARFVDGARSEYRLKKPVALGFSNGANIAAAMLMLRPEVLAGAALIRPMVPLSAPGTPDLGGVSLLMLSGAMDPLVSAANAARLADIFRAAGATVDHHVIAAGHNLSQADLVAARDFFAARTV